jgi:hypothetical protein
MLVVMLSVAILAQVETLEPAPKTLILVGQSNSKKKTSTAQYQRQLANINQNRQ